ncbi:MAG: methyltransferase domain-containing protein [Planctomycetaceae bacterium]|nr:methyltransferase domain-containing protein [Planctomycetaceae bacterium]
MPSRRLPVTIRPILLVVLGVIALPSSHAQADEAILEAAPASAVGDIDNADEPKVDLRERAPSVFRSVSRTRRAKTNDRLVELVKETVEVTSRRMLSTEQHTPWQMIHALLGLRNEWSILHEGNPVSGLDWIAAGQSFENEYWFEKTQFGGRAHPYSRPYAFEGHANQTIALISMCGVGLDREFGTADGTVTMRDMIRHAQMTVSSKDEPTWTLWALSRYLPPAAQWRNKDGDYWSIERLVKEQVDKPMKGAPCGGTHGLFALAHARNVYLQQGNQLRGVWLEADYKIRKYINTARFLQNRDGSLSSNYFRGREYNPDFNKRMASVGHTLEFLMIALPQKDLNQPWVRRAIESAARELMNNRRAYVKCSPLYHTVNALNIYLDRVNPAQPAKVAINPERKTVQADKPKPKKSGVPVKTVSQPKPVPDSTDANKLQPVPDLPQDKPVVVPAESPESAEGEWRATAKERQGPLNVPEEKIGGANPAASEPVSPTGDPAQTPSPEQVTAEEEATKESEAKPAADPAPELETITPAVPEATEEGEAPADSTQDQSDAKQTPSAIGDATTEATAAVEAVESAPLMIPDAAASAPTATPIPQREVVANTSDAKSDATVESITESAEEPEESALEAPEAAPDSDAPPAPPVLPLTTEAVDGLKPVPTLLAGTENRTVADFVAAWEHPDRAAIRARQAIVDALNVRPGASVADLGCGTGVFLKPLVDSVGADGRVYAIETSAELVEHIEGRVEAENLDGVFVVRNDSESLQLTYHRVDRVLMVDTWQYLENPAAMLLSAQTALVPGGEVLVVDAENRLDDSSRKRLLKIADQSGLSYVEDVRVDGLDGTVIRLQRPF